MVKIRFDTRPAGSCQSSGGRSPKSNPPDERSAPTEKSRPVVPSTTARPSSSRSARRDDATDFVVLLPPDGSGPGVAFQRSSAPVQEVPRVHLDLYAGDAADQAAEVSRLVGLGAREVDWPHYPPDPDFVVLADPEG